MRERLPYFLLYKRVIPVVLQGDAHGYDDEVGELRHQFAKSLEEWQEDESDEADLRARLADLVRIHEGRHRQPFGLLGGTLGEELLEQAVQPGFGHVHGSRLIRDVRHLDQDHAELQDEFPAD